MLYTKISCEGQSITTNDGEVLHFYPRAAFGFPRWLEVFSLFCFVEFFLNTFFGPNTTAKPTNVVGKLKCECLTYILTHTLIPGRCGTKRSHKDPQNGASATHTNIRKAHAIFYKYKILLRPFHCFHLFYPQLFVMSEKKE